ncbi:tetratricopeptide repeat protein [Hymenobacter psychrotolerans]|nr:tetratricopeptide repeat protein [Hymenobacter psychrotolerans]
MKKQDEMDDALYQEIMLHCKEGDEAVEDDDYDRAIHAFQQAFDLIPEPYQEWEASTWVLFSLGEAQFFNEDYAAAKESLTAVMHCPDAIGNPLIHLRLGQVQYEMGNFAKAKDELMRAYMGQGEEIFEGEDEKYFTFLKQEVAL